MMDRLAHVKLQIYSTFFWWLVHASSCWILITTLGPTPVLGEEKSSDKFPLSEIQVRDAEGFRQAIFDAKPGTRILLAPGIYPGGLHFSGPRGEPGHPVVIAAADPAHPPVFQGSSSGLQFSRPTFLELRDLVIRNMTGNGLNIDDGGSFATPAHHIVLRGLKVSDIGPTGNNDGIKLSGVVDFRIENCAIQRWGTGGGSGIDMVGCHRGLIESNLFRHTDTVGSTGIQAKGGTSQVAIRRNRFESAGGRAINIGGSTGLQFFRPPLKPGEVNSEAKDIRVEGNTFIGGGAAVAFVGVDGAVVRFNTIYHPKRWALRLLQETRAPGFVPSRNGEFTDNLVAFDSRDWAEGGINIGSGTAPETFRFARNWWYCLDEPGRSRPRLPAAEAEGVYGVSPLFRDASAGDLRLQENSPALKKAGAEAFGNRTVLGIREARFTLDSQPVFLLGFSYYGGLGAREEFVKNDLQDAQDHGFNWLRVWATWGEHDGNISAVDVKGEAREPFLRKLCWLVAECERRRLIVDVTLTRGQTTNSSGRLPDFASHQRAVETLVTALKPYRNWYLDLANERDVRDARYVSPEELKLLRELVHRLDPGRLVTASTGGHDLSMEEIQEAVEVIGLDFLAPHRPRTAESPRQTKAKTKEYLELMKKMGRVVPVLFQEPFRRGYSGWEPEAGDFLADLAGAWAGGAAGWCFHNGSQRNVPGNEPSRSFDLRTRRLFDQLDPEELKVVEGAKAILTLQ